MALNLYCFNYSDNIIHVFIKHTPETKAEPIGDQPTETKKFDVVGLIILVVSMLSINVIITQTSQFGLFSPFILGLIAILLYR